MLGVASAVTDTLVPAAAVNAPPVFTIEVTVANFFCVVNVPLPLKVNASEVALPLASVPETVMMPPPAGELCTVSAKFCGEEG